MYFILAGEGTTIGREIGQPVTTRYQPPFTFTGGTIHSVILDVVGEQHLGHVLDSRSGLLHRSVAGAR